MEVRGVKDEVSGCKESGERMFHLSTEWKNDLIQLWKEIENLKKENYAREVKFTEWTK